MSEPQIQTGKKTAPVEMTVLALLVVVFLIVSLIAQFVHFDRRVALGFYLAWGPDVAKSIGLIVAAGLTLVMYSFLYRDNALFKVAENLFVGVGLGYLAITTWRESLRPEVYDPFFNSPAWSAFWNSAMHRAVPIILGLLLLTRLSRKHSWFSRYSYALMIGWGAGVGIPITVHTYILKQLQAAVAPFQDAATAEALKAFSWPWFAGVVFPIIGAVILMLGTVAVLFYFFFSVEHKRAGAAFSRVGILFLMVAFGASFGYTVMGRMSLLIGRMQFLLFDWLKLPK